MMEKFGRDETMGRRLSPAQPDGNYPAMIRINPTNPVHPCYFVASLRDPVSGLSRGINGTIDLNDLPPSSKPVHDRKPELKEALEALHGYLLEADVGLLFSAFHGLRP